MKKIIWTFFSIVLFLSGMSYIEAKTIIEPISDNGNVKVNLSFEEGYVGGIDLTLKIKGQVSLDRVNWSSAIASNYTKRYSYDETKGTLRLIVTTGNQKNNLLDKKGNVSLGTITFKSKTGSKTNYTVELSSLTIVDATYQSISKNDLEQKGSNKFVAGISNNQSGNDNSNNNPEIKPGENENTNTNKPDSSNTTVPNKPLIPSKGDKNQTVEDEADSPLEEDKDKEKEEDNSKDNTNNDKDKPSLDGKKEEQNNTTEPVVKKKKNFPFRTVGIAFIVIALLALIGKKLKH